MSKQDSKEQVYTNFGPFWTSFGQVWTSLYNNKIVQKRRRFLCQERTGGYTQASFCTIGKIRAIKVS
jgi:hypothetical protein